jgi:trans-2,3-dihydro-3-hydroxyanthranilate isomerase
MSRSYRYLHYDVFTDHLFGGNQLAVFLDGRGLSADTMQAIAREMNFSETTFILPTERQDTDARLRIFTPGGELPIAGHPTVGSTFALARAGVIGPERETFVFGLGIGPTAVSLEWKAGALSFAWMAQPVATFTDAIEDRAGAASMLGLPEAAVAGTGLPLQVVSSGVPYLLVPVMTRAAVDAAWLRPERYDIFKQSSAIAATGVFIFSSEAGADDATAYSRMFAPDLGIAEDPATGSACGPLGCYLVRHHVVPPKKADSILNLQGVKMGRPSTIHIAIATEQDEPKGVRVGGEAVLAGEGTLYIS